MNQSFLNAGIPKKFWDIETDNIQLLNELKHMSSFIWGPVGVGKSVLAASIAKVYIKEGGNIKWINYPDFIQKLRYAVTDNVSGSFREVEDSVRYYDGVLFIDDLGAERLTDFVKEVTYRVLNTRELSMLPTVITSNFSLDQIDKIIDPRVSSRLVGMCRIVHLTGDDLRLKSKPYSFPKIKIPSPQIRKPMPESARKALENLKLKITEKSEKVKTGKI